MTEESLDVSADRVLSVPETNKASMEQVPVFEQTEQKGTVNEKAEATYATILQKVSSAAPIVETDAATDTRAMEMLTDEEAKVQKLLDLAAAKGVPHAVRVARSLSDYYALDRMHDELADKLYTGLIERGLIKKE